MIKCDCYCIEERIIGWHTPVDPKIKIVHKCNGTRERDECSCGGDRTKCDFYPEVREKALKEQEPKFGEWISVEDRVPKVAQKVLVFSPSDGVNSGYVTADKRFYVHKSYPDRPTHWMPLPTPPTEKENKYET